MSKKKKLLIAGAAALVVGATGLAVARAEGNHRDRNEQTVEINDVPAAVQQTIQQEFQGATVQRIEKHDERGGTSYEVYSVSNGKATETVIDETGRVLRSGAADDDDGD
jgi:hypothetical protein